MPAPTPLPRTTRTFAVATILALAAITLGACGDDDRLSVDLGGSGVLANLESCSCNIQPGPRGGFQTVIPCLADDGSGWELSFMVAPGRMFAAMQLTRGSALIDTPRGEIVVGPLRAGAGPGGQDLRTIELERVVTNDGATITNSRIVCTDLMRVVGQTLGDPRGPTDPDAWQPSDDHAFQAAVLSPLRAAASFTLANHPDGTSLGHALLWLGPGFDLDLREADGVAWQAVALHADKAPTPIATPSPTLGTPIASLATVAPDQPAFVATEGITVFDGTEWRRIPLPNGFELPAPSPEIVADIPLSGKALAAVHDDRVFAAAITDGGLQLYDGRGWKSPTGIAPDVVLGPPNSTGVRIVERIDDLMLCTRIIAWDDARPFWPAADTDPNAACLEVRFESRDSHALNGTVDLFQWVVTTANGARMMLFDASLPPAEGKAPGSGQIVRGGLEPLETLAPSAGWPEALDTGPFGGSVVSPIGVVRGGRHVGWLNPAVGLVMAAVEPEFWSPNALPQAPTGNGGAAASPETLLVHGFTTQIARRRWLLGTFALPIRSAIPGITVDTATCYEPEAGDLCDAPPPGTCIETCPRPAVCDDSGAYPACRTADGLAPWDPSERITPPDPDDPPDPDEPLEPTGNFLSGRVTAIVGQVSPTVVALDGGQSKMIEPPPSFTFDISPRKRFRVAFETTLPSLVATPEPLEITAGNFAEDLGLAAVHLSAGAVVAAAEDDAAPTFVASPTTGTMLVVQPSSTHFVAPDSDAPIGLSARPVATLTPQSPHRGTTPVLFDGGRLALVPDGFTDVAVIAMASGERVGTLFDIDFTQVAAATHGAAFVAASSVDGKARTFAAANGAWSAIGPELADGAALLAAGHLAIAADGRTLGGLIGPSGAPAVVDLATGTTDALPEYSLGGTPLRALTGVEPGPPGIAAVLGDGLRVISRKSSDTNNVFQPTGVMPVDTIFAFGATTPTLASVASNGFAMQVGQGTLGMLTPPFLASATAPGRIAVAETDALVIIDVDTGTITRIDGAWRDLHVGPDGTIAALGPATPQPSGFMTPLLLVAPDGGVTRHPGLFHDPRSPDHPPLALYASLDRAVALKSIHIANGECSGMCVSNAFLPIVSSAGNDGTPYRVPNALTTTLGGWGAPCVLYRRAAATIRLVSTPADGDVLMCAR